MSIEYPCPADTGILNSLGECCKHLKLLALEVDVTTEMFEMIPNNSKLANLDELTIRTFNVPTNITSDDSLDWEVCRVGSILKDKTPRLRQISQSESTSRRHQSFLMQIPPNKFADKPEENIQDPALIAQRDILRTAAWAPYST